MESPLPDPLLTLRLALTSSRSITLTSSSTSEPVTSLSTATHITFPDFSLPSSSDDATTPCSFPKAVATRFYQRPNLDHSDPTSPQYDLQTLYFGWLHRDKPTADYLKLARAQGVGFVSVTDRKMLTEYLGGKIPLEGPPTRIRELSQEERQVTVQVLGDRAVDGDGGEPGTRVSTDQTAGGAATTAAGSAATGGVGGDALQPPQKKARYTADKNDQDKVKRMLAIMDGPQFGHVVAPNETTTASAKVDKVGGGGAFHSRETVLRGERYNNFDSVRSLVAPRLQTLQASLSSSSSKPANSSSTAAEPGALKPVQSSKKKQLNPIIMISPSSTALITMHNVKDFLQDSRFIPSDQARSIAAGASTGYLAEDVVQINHNRANTSTSAANGGGGKNVETRQARYFIVDSIDALAKFGTGQEPWDRVVCVMTTGQEWQFKGYKWEEPRQLFHNVKGVYPLWKTDPSNAKIKSWNVDELRIDPRHRHIDKSVVADFWRNLESWIAANKPWLSY